MTLIKRNPALNLDLPRFFDDMLTKDLFDWGIRNFQSNSSTLPAVNIRESNEAFMVEMAAPGLNKENFKVELDNELLTISADIEQEDEREGTEFIRREYNYRSFQRSFQLPKKVVDESKIDARFKDGILQILIPKKEEAKKLPARTIKIK